MSIDLTAHFGITRDNLDKSFLIDELNHRCEGPSRLVAEWFVRRFQNPVSLPPQWELTEHRFDGAVYTVWVPNGNCLLHVMAERAIFWVGTKWDCIWWYPEFRNLLRGACFDLARLFGSNMVVYTPEVVTDEGTTLDDVLSGIRRERGNPAPSFEALDVGDDLWAAKGCYYVETIGG